MPLLSFHPLIPKKADNGGKRTRGNKGQRALFLKVSSRWLAGSLPSGLHFRFITLKAGRQRCNVPKPAARPPRRNVPDKPLIIWNFLSLRLLVPVFHTGNQGV